jgi:hypothetical protein
VHLDGLRCDGSGHDGCQAGCLIYWKTAWLKRSDEAQSVEPQGTQGPSGMTAAAAVLWRTAKTTGATPADDRYRCQATDLLKATTFVSRRERWDPRFYLQDLTSGNVRLREFLYFGTMAAFNSFVRWVLRRPYPRVCGTAGEKTPTESLNLQPGEIVHVRSKEEILQTLNTQQRNRGLWFDVEMLPFCGDQNQRVLNRVEKIVDEKTGRLIKLPGSCLILDGVSCGGMRSATRMFCPRSIFPYWREIWLQRANESAAGEAPRKA